MTFCKNAGVHRVCRNFWVNFYVAWRANLVQNSPHYVVGLSCKAQSTSFEFPFAHPSDTIADPNRRISPRKDVDPRI